MTATRQRIYYFLEHYSEMSLYFSGKLLLLIDMRSEGFYCFTSLEFAVQRRIQKNIYIFAWPVHCLDAREDILGAKALYCLDLTED